METVYIIEMEQRFRQSNEAQRFVHTVCKDRDTAIDLALDAMKDTYRTAKVFLGCGIDDANHEYLHFHIPETNEMFTRYFAKFLTVDDCEKTEVCIRIKEYIVRSSHKDQA